MRKLVTLVNLVINMTVVNVMNMSNLVGSRTLSALTLSTGTSGNRTLSPPDTEHPRILSSTC